MLNTRSTHGGQWHLLLAAFFVMALSLPGFAHDAVTTVYIVRHADRDGVEDELSDKGDSRAIELAHVLRDAGLTAIFVSTFNRTKKTAEPIDALLPDVGAVEYESPTAVAAAIRDNHKGGHVLVVGHSNTVNKIAVALGVDGVPQLDSDHYDRLFVVHLLVGSEPHLDVLRYGDPTD